MPLRNKKKSIATMFNFLKEIGKTNHRERRSRRNNIKQWWVIDGINHMGKMESEQYYVILKWQRKLIYPRPSPHDQIFWLKKIIRGVSIKYNYIKIGEKSLIWFSRNSIKYKQNHFTLTSKLHLRVNELVSKVIINN